MNVLTVFAHPGVRSFCHAVLERFDAGLRDAGHTNEIVDLYAIGFDPILRPRDTPSWLTETIPDDMLDRMRLRETLLEEAGGPLKRLALKRLIGDRDARGIIRLLRERYQAMVVGPLWRRIRARAVERRGRSSHAGSAGHRRMEETLMVERTSSFSIPEARCEPRIRAVSELLGLSFTTPRLILEVLVHSGLAPILVWP